MGGIGSKRTLHNQWAMRQRHPYHLRRLVWRPSACLLSLHSLTPADHSNADSISMLHLEHDVPTSIHVVVVVSSLVAIMKDQVSDLGSKQISAIQVTSSMDEVVECEIIGGQFSMIYISPELFLRKAKWREVLHSDLF